MGKNFFGILVCGMVGPESGKNQFGIENVSESPLLNYLLHCAANVIITQLLWHRGII